MAKRLKGNRIYRVKFYYRFSKNFSVGGGGRKPLFSYSYIIKNALGLQFLVLLYKVDTLSAKTIVLSEHILTVVGSAQVNIISSEVFLYQ